MAETETEPKPTRDDLRKKIFSSQNMQFQKEKLTLFGQSLEIRQPSLGMILAAQENEDRTKAIVMLLVNHCYVPETDEKVFEEGDVAMLLSMPFGDDLLRANKVIEKMTAIDVMSAEKNSEKTPADATS